MKKDFRGNELMTYSHTRWVAAIVFILSASLSASKYFMGVGTTLQKLRKTNFKINTCC